MIFANLGQGVLFLSGVGRSANLEVSATMIGIALLLIQFGRRNSQVFTESIHIRDKIRKQNIDLERAIDDKSNFLNAASHDMGSPLSAMGIYLESLEKYIPSGKAKKDLEKIYKASEELNDLCNILLDLSKFDAKALEPHFTEFRLDEILNDIVDGVEKDAKIKELTIHLISDAVSIISDKFNIERLIRNLVENAVNYTEKGSIRIETKSAPAGFHLIISDTGPGISKGWRYKLGKGTNCARGQYWVS